jgi:serine/threonine protein kinase/class 3 adenylate cyclase
MSGRQIGGRYVLERQVATGGMGTIWVAFDPQLQRRVALKLLTSQRVSSSDAARRQFESEAHAIARLRHPNVVQIHDYGIDGDAPYLVMELLEGEDLETRLERRGRLSPTVLATLLNQAARALTAAHAAGIVHRDLKPANFFLVREEGQEVLKVLDFGLARLMRRPEGAEPGESGAGLFGTLRYMSPEQMRDEPHLDHRGDLWSLAVVAYRALTGQFPLDPRNVGGLLSGTFRPPAVPASSLVPELGPAVDAFFARALDVDPAGRFASAHELASAFAALVESCRSSRPAKILVVDDEPDVEVLMRQRFRKQLRASVYEMHFASNGEDALEKLRQHPDTDVIISDINMPRMDGLTFLSHVGSVSPLAKVIIVSAYSDMRNIRTAMNRGAHDFVVKPLDFQDLEATLAKTLKHVAELRQAVRSTEENQLLRLFVHGGIVERVLPLVRGPGLMSSERVEATVAFVDVKDFTPVTRHESPEAVIQRLNANFEVIVPELTSRGGVVDKFIGDAVMAVFRGPGHLDRAVEACMAVRQQLQAMAFRGGEQSPYVHGVSIGLDSGALVSGNLGGAALGRLDHSVLGDVVNTAARLASLAGREQILISDALRQRLEASFACEPAGERHLPGTGAPLAVHAIVGRRGGAPGAASGT